jgi:hypothetical protein
MLLLVSFLNLGQVCCFDEAYRLGKIDLGRPGHPAATISRDGAKCGVERAVAAASEKHKPSYKAAKRGPRRHKVTTSLTMSISFLNFLHLISCEGDV